MSHSNKSPAVNGWQKKEEHCREIREILIGEGCMDRQGRIRRWKPGIWDILKLKGHTSLSPEKCGCCNPKKVR